MSVDNKHGEWREAVVLENKQVSRGNYWIKIKATDEEEIFYQPGNVLSLALYDSYDVLHRKAYTVSRANIQEKTFEHLYRHIPNGNFTGKLVRLTSGDKIHFRGIYHKPIHEEINPEARYIVGISTGSGIAPLFGFIEKVLSEKSVSIPIKLYSGFRYNDDLCLKSELDSLSEKYSNFSWMPTFTRPTDESYGLKGRVTESVPPILDNLYETHFHLVGNGKMVSEFLQALIHIGIKPSMISKETYFNHGFKPEHNIIEEISNKFKIKS